MKAALRPLGLALLMFPGLLSLSQPLLAAEETDQEEGNVIRITSDAPQAPQPEQPGELVPIARYWIGISGGPLPPILKAHVVLPDGNGLLVQAVERGSPAERAGIQQFDILTRANGKPIGTINELSKHVGDQGEMKGRLAIELLRAGRTETVWVTPEKRPIIEPVVENPWRGIGIPFGNNPNPNVFNQRSFVRSLFVNGYQVRVVQQNDEPAKITVNKDGETWQAEDTGPESLDDLPEEVRPMIEQLLNRQGQFPDIVPLPMGIDDPFGGLHRMQQRFDQMLLPPEPPPGIHVQPQPSQEKPEPVELEIPAE